MVNNNQKTKTLNLRVYCQAYYDTKIDVPAGLTKEEAFAYAEQRLSEIPVTTLNYISDSDSIDEDDLELGIINFTE